MLPDNLEVEEVILGKNGISEGLRKNQILIDMSSITPLTTKKIYEKIEKKDAEIKLNDDSYKNFLKIQAFDKNPRAHFFVDGKRIIITSAEYKNGQLKILRVIPEGKKETLYKDFLKSNS